MGAGCSEMLQPRPRLLPATAATVMSPRRGRNCGSRTAYERFGTFRTLSHGRRLTMGGPTDVKFDQASQSLVIFDPHAHNRRVPRRYGRIKDQDGIVFLFVWRPSAPTRTQAPVAVLPAPCKVAAQLIVLASVQVKMSFLSPSTIVSWLGYERLLISPRRRHPPQMLDTTGGSPRQFRGLAFRQRNIASFGDPPKSDGI